MSEATKTERILTWFLASAGAILAITGAAKVWSAVGTSKALSVADPIVGIPFGKLMLLVGLAELAIAACCFFMKEKWISLAQVAWLSSSFLIYRIGLWSIGWHKPCSCMGSLTEALHLSPGAADTIMKIVLVYLVAGSYGLLIWRWRQSRLPMNFKIA